MSLVDLLKELFKQGLKLVIPIIVFGAIGYALIFRTGFYQFIKRVYERLKENEKK